MNFTYELFNKKFLANLQAMLENRFEASVDFSKLISWRSAVELVFQYDPFDFELDTAEGFVDMSLLLETLKTRDDVTAFFEKHFTLNTPTISGAIIVKDEERCIKRCLDSMLPIFDEIVVVDTGSTDKTLDILSSMNNPRIKIFHMKWEDDFAKARNFALDNVTSDWVFFIDADEYFEAPVSDNFKSVLAALSAFSDIDSVVCTPKIIDATRACGLGSQRIFKTSSNIRYFGIIHEETRIWKNNSWSSTKVISLNIPLAHDGYISDVYDSKNKGKRNLELNKKMMSIEPDNPRWLSFYVRDGQNVLPPGEICEMIENAILINKNKEVTIGNIRISGYTDVLLNAWAQATLQELKTEKLFKIVDCMEELFPESSNNSMYYKTLAEVMTLNAKKRKLLSNVMEFRKNHFEPQYRTLHSEGANIDFLIGVLLFEGGHFEKAFAYLDFVKDQFLPPDYKAQYNHLIATCKARENAL